MSTSRNGQPADEQGFVASTDGTDLNATIEGLLALRSVRDQFADAKLDLLTDGLAHELDDLENLLIDHLAEQREHRDGLGLLTVSVVGDFNAGKSTFINALLGMDVCPVGDEPTTASVTHFIHGGEERIEQELADGTWTALDKSKYRALAQHKKEGDSEPNTFRISVNSPVLDHIRLVDTPGFNAPPPNANDTKVTEEAVKESDVLFVLMDANKGNPSSTLLDQLDRISQNSTNESRLPVFLLLNKAEGLPPSQRAEVKRVCEELHSKRFRDVVLVSALQLSDAEDEGAVDPLDIAMQRMRSAYERRQSFQENISAERTIRSYRLDISGNVYDMPMGLASRKQLAEMVNQVSTERHALLEQQFERHTLQLREGWQTTLSDLEEALSASAGDGDGDETRHTETALESIEKAKYDTLYLVNEIFSDIPSEITFKSQRIEKGIFSDTVYHQICYLNEAIDAMDKHDYWHSIDAIYKGLLSYLKQSLDINFDFTSQQVVEELKEKFLGLIRKAAEATVQTLVRTEERNGKLWLREYKHEPGRDNHLKSIISCFESQGIDYRDMIIQEAVIGKLSLAVISTTGINEVEVAKKTEELSRLQERINKMKEHTFR